MYTLGPSKLIWNIYTLSFYFSDYTNTRFSSI
jgi:hypothetical protein